MWSLVPAAWSPPLPPPPPLSLLFFVHAAATNVSTRRTARRRRVRFDMWISPWAPRCPSMVSGSVVVVRPSSRAHPLLPSRRDPGRERVAAAEHRRTVEESRRAPRRRPGPDAGGGL